MNSFRALDIYNDFQENSTVINQMAQLLIWFPCVKSFVYYCNKLLNSYI